MPDREEKRKRQKKRREEKKKKEAAGTEEREPIIEGGIDRAAFFLSGVATQLQHKHTAT